jgi:hypothetical protein
MAKKSQIYLDGENRHWVVKDLTGEDVILIQDLYDLEEDERRKTQRVKASDLKSGYKLIGKAGVNREYYDV